MPEPATSAARSNRERSAPSDAGRNNSSRRMSPASWKKARLRASIAGSIPSTSAVSAISAHDADPVITGMLELGKLALQALADVIDEGVALAADVRQFVDPVDEDDDLLLVQAAQYPQQSEIGGRQRLPRRQDDEIDVRLIEAASRDLVAHQKWVVRAGRIDDSGGKIERPAIEVQKSRLGDVGELPRLRSASPMPAGLPARA